MPVRSASAVWEGGVKDGKGRFRVGEGVCEGAYTFGSRFDEEPGSNPEELLGAAEAACFTMAFALALTQKGHPPKTIRASAKVTVDRVATGYRITGIALDADAEVPGLDEATVRAVGREAAAGCPVSQALTGTEIGLEVRKSG